MKKGMCSISFRSLSVDEIIALAKKAGLDFIEWGGDIHAPAGDIKKAKEVALLTANAGLSIHSYGSYYHCTANENFAPVAESAYALGAKVIRIWADDKDAEEFTEDEYKSLVRLVQNAADIAAKYNLVIAFEHHHHTYCNNAENALKLLNDVNRDNVKTYWQPAYWKADDSREIDASAIKQFGDRIVGVHVYKWVGTNRLTLKEGIEDWNSYIKMLGENYYYLEFAKDDSIQQFLEDAACFVKFVN